MCAYRTPKHWCFTFWFVHFFKRLWAVFSPLSMGSQLFLLSSTSNTLRRSCLDRFFPSTPPKLQHESLESPNYSCSVSYPCRYAFKKLFLVCHLSCINVERRCVFVVTLSSPPDNILFTQICIFLPPASGCPTVPHFLFQHRNCRGKYQTSSAGKDMKPLKSIAIFALCLKSSLSYLHRWRISLLGLSVCLHVSRSGSLCPHILCSRARYQPASCPEAQQHTGELFNNLSLFYV